MAKETLGRFIERVMQEHDPPLTYKDVERRSRGKIKAGHLNDIVKGRTANPTVATLKAVSKGLGVSEDLVFALARGVSPDEPPVEDAELAALFYKYGDLSEEDKKELRVLIRVIDSEIERRISK